MIKPETVLDFGKHKGSTAGTLVETAPLYILWMFEELDVDLDEELYYDSYTAFLNNTDPLQSKSVKQRPKIRKC